MRKFNERTSYNRVIAEGDEASKKITISFELYYESDCTLHNLVKNSSKKFTRCLKSITELTREQFMERIASNAPNSRIQRNAINYKSLFNHLPQHIEYIEHLRVEKRGTLRIFYFISNSVMNIICVSTIGH